MVAYGMDVTDWLLAGDPAIRYQVLRDLVDAPAGEVAAERARIAGEGWGAALLAARDPDGLWAGGACFPGRPFEQVESAMPSQPWTSTHPTLDLLRLLGVEPAALRETVELIRANGRWEYDDLPYWDGEVEPCINGLLVAYGAYFGVDMAPVVERLLTQRLDDGGWNCEAENGSVRSSFDTTICVLEGLQAFERATGGTAETTAARRSGEEYLLERRLFRRQSTGEVVNPAYRVFFFPPRWHYDVLRALDYFRADGNPPDPRAAETIQLVRDRQTDDGRWTLDHAYPGVVPFELEPADGSPSRWNTLRAMRVLRWAAP